MSATPLVDGKHQPSQPAPTEAHVAAPLWSKVVLGFVAPAHRDVALRALAHLPITVLLALQAVFSLRLTNTAFEDEALYVDAGHHLIDHWAHGADVAAYGTYFSGLPQLYPVLAALLDDVGGLQAVRASSTVLMLLTTLALRAVTTRWWGPRAAGAAAVVFALTGPVVHLGAFATFDAATVFCLAAATWLLVRRAGVSSAAVAGVALALAVSLKYTGAVFLPVVLAVAVLTSVEGRRRAWRRPAAAAVTAVTLLALLYAVVGDQVRGGVLFTTAARTALSPEPPSVLLAFLLRDLWPLLLPAVLGAVLLSRSLRSTAAVLALLGGAALLPLAQLRLGEMVSFEKHLAYSSLFLAPLAGYALARVSRHGLGVLLGAALVWALAVNGLARSHAMYQWPDVSRVVALVGEDPSPGRYLSTTAWTLGYYTRRDAGVHWEDHYGLFDSGAAAMQRTVDDGVYEMIVLNTAETGNRTNDLRIASFRRMVQSSSNYRLVAPAFLVRPYSPDRWLVYGRTPASRSR